MTAPAANDEQARLLARLERALNETSAEFARGSVLTGGLLLVLAIAVAATGGRSLAGLLACCSVGTFLFMFATARKHAPEKMRPVLEAVRDAPDRVTLLRHYETSESYRTFVTHWVLIGAAGGHLLVKATDDWEELFAMLQRRCPSARVIHE